MTLQELLELRALLSIAHHVPGRLRLRLDPRIRAHPAAKELESWSANGTGILSTRINPIARSLVVEYDPKRIDPALLDAFLAGATAPAETLAKVFGVTTQA
jgi:hypothetical protein